MRFEIPIGSRTEPQVLHDMLAAEGIGRCRIKHRQGVVIVDAPDATMDQVRAVWRAVDLDEAAGRIAVRTLSIERARESSVIEGMLVCVEQNRDAAERLGLTARAAEYASQIEVLRGKLAKIGNVSEVGATLEARPSSATPDRG